MYLGSECNNINTLPHMSLGDVKIEPKPSVKLLGITLDNRINFNEHINNVCKTANQNTNCLARIRNNIDVKKLKTFV